MLDQLAAGLDVTSLIICLLLFYLCYYLLTTPRNIPPGPIRLPVIGSLLSLIASRGDIMEAFEKWRRIYGDVYTVQLGNVRFVILNSYESIHEAYVKKGDIFSGRPINWEVFRKTFEITGGEGIVFNEGPSWKGLRRVTLITMREFGVGKKTLEERVREEASAAMEVLDKSQGHEISMKPVLAKFTCNVICSIIFGTRFEYEDPKFIELTSLVEKAVKQNGFFAPVHFFPFLRFLPFMNEAVDSMVKITSEVDSFIQALLQDHEENFDLNEIRDFVDLYIKTGQENKTKQLYEFSASNMRRTIVDLFIAGTETTSTTVDWLILYMVQFPEIQSRCQKEIDQAIGKARKVEVEDRSKLPFTEAVICEIMRLVPIVPTGVPHVAVKEGTIAGFTIPADTVLMTNQRAVHWNPKVWPDPMTFNPERFLDKGGHFCAPKDHVLPFSIGPRICLGEALARMELFILFTTLLQFYTFTMDNGRKPDLEGHLGLTYTAHDQKVLATKR